MTPKPCRQCNGKGVLTHWNYGTDSDCWDCGGSGVTPQPKYRATCETCGKRQPRATTAFTANDWMQEHNATHRPKAADQ